jgi:DUF3040 family protein
MLNERDDRVLRDLEHWTNIEDPAFARRLGRADPWARWRSAWRHGTRVPVALVVAAVALAAFALHVSSLGLLFLAWALTGMVRWAVVANRRGLAALPGAPNGS